jgi:hypothetical protein
VLRAASILLVVATHAGVVGLKGGAHLLLAVSGWNFARFQLPLDGRRLARSMGRIAVPSACWIALLLVATDDYDIRNLLFVHTQLGDTFWDQRWRYWFVEALVQILAVLGAVLAVPALKRLEARRPFAFAFGLLAAALVLREVADVARTFHRPQTVAWLFVLGWTAHRARSFTTRALVSMTALVATQGFFHDTGREVVVIGGALLLLWTTTLPVARWLHGPVGALASASLFVYLSHWQVYPPVREVAGGPAAVLASLAVGLAIAALVQRPRRGPDRRSPERTTAGSQVPEARCAHDRAR